MGKSRYTSVNKAIVILITSTFFGFFLGTTVKPTLPTLVFTYLSGIVLDSRLYNTVT